MIWQKVVSLGEQKTRREKWKLDHLWNLCAINARLLREKEKLWSFVLRTHLTNKLKAKIHFQKISNLENKRYSFAAIFGECRWNICKKVLSRAFLFMLIISIKQCDINQLKNFGGKVLWQESLVLIYHEKKELK